MVPLGLDDRSVSVVVATEEVVIARWGRRESGWMSCSEVSCNSPSFYVDNILRGRRNSGVDNWQVDNSARLQHVPVCGQDEELHVATSRSDKAGLVPGSQQTWTCEMTSSCTEYIPRESSEVRNAGPQPTVCSVCGSRNLTLHSFPALALPKLYYLSMFVCGIKEDKCHVL